MVVGTEAEHSPLVVPTEPLAAEAAELVLVGDCVVAFEVSPGNCTAVWGLIDDAAFMPPSESDPVAGPPDNGIVDVGTLSGSMVTTVPVVKTWVSWDCAIANVASHIIIAKMNARFIGFSDVTDEKRGSISRVPKWFIDFP